MKKYIVGGYVRDKLMGLKPRDRDWLIVGANTSDIEYLKSIGYTQVGKDFPVFLSPDGEEYALARIERKIGTGYTGFETITKGVSIQEDLKRRDFTINSIAYDPLLEIYTDPYGGRDDLKNKIIRHTSKAFSEDPLRVLRLARFYARFKDFTIHESTDKLARDMVKNKVLDELSTDRIYMEFKKAFDSANSYAFIKCLDNFGYIKHKFPNISLYGKTEILKNISTNSTPKYTESFMWTALLGEEKIQKNRYCNIPMSNEVSSFCEFIQNHSKVLYKFNKLGAEELCSYFDSTNIKNKGGEKFLYKVTEYLMLTGKINYEQEDYIIKVHDAYYSAEIPDVKKLVKEGKLEQSKIKDFVHELHLESIKKFLK